MFFVFSVLGVALGLVFLVVRGERARLGPASAMVLGLVGAWNGALFASTFHRGGWIAFGPEALAGALLGAIGAIAALELAADAYLRREAE